MLLSFEMKASQSHSTMCGVSKHMVLVMVYRALSTCILNRRFFLVFISFAKQGLQHYNGCWRIRMEVLLLNSIKFIFLRKLI